MLSEDSASRQLPPLLPWVVAIAMIMEQLDSTILNTAIPTMAAALHVTPLSLRGVVASYVLSLAVCIPVSGWIADRYGTRKVFAPWAESSGALSRCPVLSSNWPVYFLIFGRSTRHT